MACGIASLPVNDTRTHPAPQILCSSVTLTERPFRLSIWISNRFLQHNVSRAEILIPFHQTLSFRLTQLLRPNSSETLLSAPSFSAHPSEGLVPIIMGLSGIRTLEKRLSSSCLCFFIHKIVGNHADSPVGCEDHRG